MQPIDTRTIIIQRSFELLLAKGYDAVSITDIQLATGFSRGLLYHYFGNKESLFIEAIKSHFSAHFTLDMAQIEHYNAEQLRGYIVAKYRKLIDESLQGASIINYDFLCYRAMQQNPQVTMLYQRVRNDELRAWSMALQNSLQQGQIRQQIDIQKMAHQFVYTTDGVWLAAVTPAVEVDLVSELDAAFEMLYSLIKI